MDFSVLAVAQVDDFPLIGFQEFHHNFFHDFPTRASSQFPAVDRWLRSCLLMDFAAYRIGSTILIVITYGLRSSRRGATR